jgi:dipeptidyl aminopeptidase/acylaminoacyl peptidase
MTGKEYAAAVFHLPYTERPSMRVSPDGKWVAWTWFGLREYADVYVAPTDGSSAPIPLTDSSENSFIASWTPDSRSVLVAQDHDGDERYRLYRIELEHPCKLKLLTDDAPHYFLRGGELHPNGRWLVYGANYDFDARRELEATWIWRQDLVTGERRALARPHKTPVMLPVLSPTGEHVIYTRTELHRSGRQTWIVDIEGENDRELYSAGVDKQSLARWFPDGRRLVILADTATHKRVGFHDLETNATRWLIDNPERNIENAFAPFGSDKLVVIQAQGARISSALLDPDIGAVGGVETLWHNVSTMAGNLYLLAPVAENEWVAHYSVSNQPDDFVRVALNASGAPQENLNPETFVSLGRVWDYTRLTRSDFLAALDFRWHSVDGLEIQGWLYRAENPRGTIVYVHGGPTYHHEDRMNPEIQFYVRAGFNVLDPNYRGSTGFSMAYREAIKKQGWGGLEQQDIRTGIEGLQQAGIAEKNRVGITGTSYGGYSAWYAITHFPREIVAASAPVCGMTDLVIDYETTRPDLRPYSEEMMGGTPAQVPEKYNERSPIHRVENIRGTLLIVQGMQDPNVTPENVRAVTARLQDAGIEYQVLAFDDEGHGVYKPKNLQILCERIAETFGAAFGK